MVLEQTGHFRIRNSDPGTTLRAVAMLAERMNKNVAFEVRDSGTLILGAGRARRSSSCSLIVGGGGLFPVEKEFDWSVRYFQGIESSKFK